MHALLRKKNQIRVPDRAKWRCVQSGQSQPGQVGARVRCRKLFQKLSKPTWTRLNPNRANRAKAPTGPGRGQPGQVVNWYPVKGMKAINEVGGKTIAQNKESSVIYGMPKAASEAGAIEAILDIKDIGNYLVNNL